MCVRVHLNLYVLVCGCGEWIYCNKPCASTSVSASVAVSISESMFLVVVCLNMFVSVCVFIVCTHVKYSISMTC